jgi:4-amino-4-deoxy-L-arabinose transferase-like glycosyltransferase
VVFLLVWSGVIFVFFSVSHSKLPGYLLPATIPLSILMAKVWSTSKTAGSDQRDWLTGGFSALMLLGLLMTAVPQLFRLTLEHRLATRVQPTLLPLLRQCLLFSGIALVGLGFVGRNSTVRARAKPIPETTFVLLALTVVLLAVRWALPVRIYANASSSRQLAETILASPEQNLALYGYYFFRTSLPFYLRRPVGLVTADGGETTSKYVVSRFKDLRAWGGRTSPAPLTAGADPNGRLPAPSGSAESTWLSGLPKQAPSVLPVLIDARELHELARNSAQPFLTMVHDSNLQNLMREVGELEALWTGWKYSVWKVRGQRPRDGGRVSTAGSSTAEASTSTINGASSPP